VRIGLFTGQNTLVISLATVWTANLLVHGTCSD